MELNRAYNILGVSQTATKEEIEKAYRKKALIHHPDNKQTGSHKGFLEIKEAKDAIVEYLTRPAYSNGSFSNTSSSNTGSKDYARKMYEEELRRRMQEQINRIYEEMLKDEMKYKPKYKHVPWVLVLILVFLLTFSLDLSFSIHDPGAKLTMVMVTILFGGVGILTILRSSK